MSLLRALANAVRPTLLQRRGVSTAPSLRGLEEFFEKPPAEGEKIVVGKHHHSSNYLQHPLLVNIGVS